MYGCLRDHLVEAGVEHELDRCNRAKQQGQHGQAMITGRRVETSRSRREPAVRDKVLKCMCLRANEQGRVRAFVDSVGDCDERRAAPRRRVNTLSALSPLRPVSVARSDVLKVAPSSRLRDVAGLADEDDPAVGVDGGGVRPTSHPVWTVFQLVRRRCFAGRAAQPKRDDGACIPDDAEQRAFGWQVERAEACSLRSSFSAGPCSPTT